MIKQGNLRGERNRYSDDSIGLTVWYPLSPEDEEVGICFDFSDGDSDDLIKLVERLKHTEPKLIVEEFVPEPKHTLRERFCRKFVNPVGWWLVTR